MQVILLEPGRLGKTGDVVNVKPGYARNWLIPQGIAAPATASNMKTLEAQVRARKKQQEREKAQAEDLASRLNGVAVELSVRAGEGKIYGAVTHADVADALDKLGFDVDRRRIEMPKTVKEIGEYDIAYRAHPEVTIPMKLVVHAQK
ncbi:ribosomal protein L9 [Deinococcus geothermalis DSM 11300]|uniref:Large ribosomal subunit protein bL9 n=1 Tax=Deinococcus geothermalis (strain DSM 11300 / CIP 105573 / AG-3a) TaxID=319795 RepID=RL9_DEIGD|nr:MULTISPECIES: 50S ribosomal protein L9 [Deinococcus]Q1J218.1 RecName: Full=Large ribosomal subunit protein bL9; AltName: Full=50S ribosomal protein L9 [Deinococcus geothermalis DSM 11300]ABF44466.1 ribosomal protein L9 [Deinococcus geothermalis DSM 11300]MBI0446454.1 50S ribosomal protein L9 [Deinococcus sp. DB0503]TDE84910.1 50S ribosomal protein L9 [Deinococcus sp. S9]